MRAGQNKRLKVQTSSQETVKHHASGKKNTTLFNNFNCSLPQMSFINYVDFISKIMLTGTLMIHH